MFLPPYGKIYLQTISVSLANNTASPVPWVVRAKPAFLPCVRLNAVLTESTSNTRMGNSAQAKDKEGGEGETQKILSPPLMTCATACCPRII